MLRWFSKPLSVRQMRLLCASLLAGFALCGALQGLCWGRTQLDAGAALCADTLRLHIRAASDAVADQSAKLRVRDAVLAAIPEAVTRADTPQQAAAALQTALPALQNAADNALHRAHSAQTARLRLERFAFAARDYGSFALPGGEYTALRIELGGAQGRNWFCVLYPALCLSGAQSDYPTKAENALVFGRYEVRWAVKDAVMQIINKK